jgi:ABC-type multidrug transport system fused ATPase/permease subunit
MLRLTFQLVLKDVLRRQVLGLIGVLVLLSILLGTIPALKSQLESQIINVINDTITADASTRPPGLRDALQRARPIVSGEGSENQPGVPEKIAISILQKVPKLSDALILYLCITVLGYALGVVSAILRSSITRSCFARLRAEGLRKGLVAETRVLYSFSNIPGQYAMAIQQGATNVSNMYGNAIQAGQYVFALGTTIALVWSKSWTFGVSCLALVIFQASVSILQAKRLQHRRETLDEQRNNLVGRSDDIISKKDIILAYEQETHYEQELEKLSAQYAEIDKRLEVSDETYNGASNLISDLGRIAILVVGLIFSLRLGPSAISSIGDAYFLISIYTRLSAPAESLMYQYDEFKRSESTSAAFLKLLEGHEALQPNEDPRSRLDERLSNTHLSGNIVEFDQVAFRYEPTGQRILSGCTFRVPANKTTLVVGRSGSGKTTIARILLGFARIEKGKIWIDGQSIASLSPVELRLKMSYVSQGDHIVDDTVLANLFTKGGIPTPAILATLRSVGVCGHDSDESFLNQPAKNLSIGQQQRLALARMMLDDSKITIMDEPLSGVDVFTFRELLPELTRFLKDPHRTVLMFSHRLSFAAYADHVVILGDRGSIDEEGSVEELKSGGSIFPSLFATALAELQPAVVRATPSGER